MLTVATGGFDFNAAMSCQ